MKKLKKSGCYDIIKTEIYIKLNHCLSGKESDRLLEFIVDSIGEKIEETESIRPSIGYLSIDGIEKGIVHEHCGE